MEIRALPSTGSIAQVDRKKAKKWSKKVEKGLIQSSSTYFLARYAYKLTGVPTLRYVTDKTREKSEYNLLASELRNFILSLYYPDQPIQKHFEVTNRGFIRYVVQVHLCDVEGSLGDILPDNQIYVMKTTRSIEETPELTEKLLTIPFQECSETELLLNPTVNIDSMSFSDTIKSEVDQESSSAEVLWKQLHPYLANPSMLKLYNFPVLCENDPSTAPLKTVKTEEIDASVPLVMEESTEVSEDIGNVPATESSLGIFQKGLELLPSLESLAALRIFPSYSSVQYYQDFPKNECLLQHHEFLETLDYPSPHYDQLQAIFPTAMNIPPLLIAALDCEMCETTAGVEVTRVTLIDQDEQVILDLLVKPDHPVINYRTQYSGITQELLENVSTKLLQVQAVLCLLLVKKTILIGHSLENDLRVLRLLHSQLIDTTFLYPHPQGYPYRTKLKTLAKDFLKVKIQQATTTPAQQSQGNPRPKGHDSIEDAKTALDLVKLKLAKGPSFGLPSTDSIRIPVTKRLSYLQIPSLLFHFLPTTEKEEPENAVSTGAITRKSSMTRKFLESLISSETKIVDVESFPDIVQKIKSFAIENQTARTASDLAASLVDNSTEATLGKRKHLESGIEEEDTFLTDQQQLVDRQHFIHLSIPNTQQKVPEIREFLNQLEKTLKVTQDSELQTHGLCIITSQRSLERIHYLVEKKKKVYNFQNRMTSLTWTREEERELKELIKLNSLGQVAFLVL